MGDVKLPSGSRSFSMSHSSNFAVYFIAHDLTHKKMNFHDQCFASLQRVSLPSCSHTTNEVSSTKALFQDFLCTGIVCKTAVVLPSVVLRPAAAMRGSETGSLNCKVRTDLAAFSTASQGSDTASLMATLMQWESGSQLLASLRPERLLRSSGGACGIDLHGQTKCCKR